MWAEIAGLAIRILCRRYLQCHQDAALYQYALIGHRFVKSR
jgi:hypothetical protein